MKYRLCTRFSGGERPKYGGSVPSLNEGSLESVREMVFFSVICMTATFWKSRVSPLFLAILTFSAGSVGPTTVSATDSEAGSDGGEVTSDETVSGLPVWEEGDFREGFDVRIWPERIVMWLEQENLRDLIADPRTPGPEKEALKKVLAMQLVWPKRI